MSISPDTNVFITGGSGFMGSHFVRYLYHNYPNYRIVNLDALTYAGNPDNLRDVEALEEQKRESERRYHFIKGDICDEALVERLFTQYHFHIVFHFAAETHVDRSLFNFSRFIRTNIEGTRVLLEAVYRYHTPRMVHISTDEVYGNVPEGFSTEDSPLNPSSPYSASKTAADMLARTYSNVYGTPILIIRSGNNYGTHQYPEKLIPLSITNLLEGNKIPVHGNGTQVRSWVHVEDFSRAVDVISHEGPLRGIYNIGGEHRSNLDIISLVARELQKDHREHLMYVGDRPVADTRYAPLSNKLENELSWKRLHTIEEAIKDIIHWYKHNTAWWQNIKAKKDFSDHYDKQSRALWY